jgi:hypothetical protein
MGRLTTSEPCRRRPISTGPLIDHRRPPDDHSGRVDSLRLAQKADQIEKGVEIYTAISLPGNEDSFRPNGTYFSPDHWLVYRRQVNASKPLHYGEYFRRDEPRGVQSPLWLSSCMHPLFSKECRPEPFLHCSGGISVYM